LKNYLNKLKLGNGREKREYALRALSREIQSLPLFNYDSAYRVLIRYLAPEIIKANPDIKPSISVPQAAEEAMMTQGGNQLLVSEGARIDIFQALLRNCPASSQSLPTLIDIALDNYLNNTKIISDEGKAALLADIIHATRTAKPDLDKDKTWNDHDKFQGQVENIKGVALGDVGHWRNTVPGHSPSVVNLVRECMLAKCILFSDEELKLLLGIEHAVDHGEQSEPPPRYEGPVPFVQ